MKITVTLNQPTTTENGRVVPAGTFEAEYNGLRGLHGYDSSNMDRYDALRMNESLIERAIDDAETNNSVVGTVVRNGKTCTVQLPARAE